jgi:predicted RNA-binding protein with PIN domain
MSASANRRIIVDAMNVIGSRPTGWWRDRQGAMRALIEKLAAYARTTGDEVIVVLDSEPFDVPVEAKSIEVRFAPGGPDAADDMIVDIVADDAHPESLLVATSDKRLAARVRMMDPETISAGALRRVLDSGQIQQRKTPL